MYVIGTAGHVDHGKSTLVRALTGIDPDRLREEKERGLTIDLGFAWLTLPSGREVSIVDVPGHDRFIKNMLAGAGGVDLVLLVVAADEGQMPQTREHLAILDLLDVPSGIIVITRCDLADPEYVDLVEADLQDIVAGTRLAGAPCVRVSGLTGEGLPALLTAIDSALDRTPAKRDLGRPRLPVDRAFTIAGFGTVVTGTLLDGALELGQEVELQPGRLKARVRGLQRHKSKVGRLEPGTRAAVNLSGIRTEDVSRGMVLAKPGTLSDVFAVDVKLKAAATLPHPLSHDAGVTFLCATSEAQAKLRLLDCDALLRGKEAWAQLILESPIAISRGDHCVVRTPNDTVAGGVIVAINPKRRRRNHAPTLEALERLLEGSPAERLLDLLLQAPLSPEQAASRLGYDASVFAEAVALVQADGSASLERGLLVADAWAESMAGRLVAVVEEVLAADHLRESAPREHARSALRLAAPVFDIAVAAAVSRGRLVEDGAGLAPPGYAVQLTAREEEAVSRFLAAVRAGGVNPPTDGLPSPPLLAFLAKRGLVVDTGAGVVFDAATFVQMVASTTAVIEAEGPVSMARVRDLLGTSRKYAQAFLEHLDNTHVTRRVGDTRVLR
ncbi:hypothetical protein AYO38_02135 [bacterium SCGC AG-212-C10]|nr:hypothetical protein AYO38_02135 [bacterium SCGC AG-212-C10]